MNKLLLAVAVSALAFGSTALAAEAAPAGATLLAERCSVCHAEARPQAAKKTVEQWEATVTRMIGKGAKLSAEEKQILVEYLAENFKP